MGFSGSSSTGTGWEDNSIPNEVTIDNIVHHTADPSTLENIEADYDDDDDNVRTTQALNPSPQTSEKLACLNWDVRGQDSDEVNVIFEPPTEKDVLLGHGDQPSSAGSTTLSKGKSQGS